jgi:hypothetical protein
MLEMDGALPVRAMRSAREAGMITGPMIVLLAACVLTAIWIIVLYGSSYFGPR